MTGAPPRLVHPLLEACGVDHSFGIKGMVTPDGLCRPEQVHGREVATLAADGSLSREHADAVVSGVAGAAIAVVTADCVPVLAASEGGEVVAAIHAGWRGLAAGVVAAGIAALRDRAPRGARLSAAVGPHIGQCCYEVDAPVTDGLRARFGREAEAALRSSRPGHQLLDLGRLVADDLRRAGIEADRLGFLADVCTRCDALRFHSYRRDGPRAGRLVHYIVGHGSPAVARG